jgi:hypothetical protein
MAQATTNTTRISIHEEAAYGEAPSGTGMQELRYTGGSPISAGKKTVQSETIKTNRNRQKPVIVGIEASGALNFELVYGIAEQGVLFEGALSTDFVPAAVAPVSLTINAAARTIARGAGSFITDGVVVGMWIRTYLFTNAGNNGVFKVASVVALTITLDASTTGHVNETGPGTTYLKGNMFRNGATKKSYLINRSFTDLTNVHDYANGMVVDALSLSLESESIITGSCSFQGKEAKTSASAVGGTLTGAGSTQPMTASVSVAQLLKNGAAFPAEVQSMSFESGNNLRRLGHIGSKYPAGVNQGFFDFGGSLTAYLESLAMYDELINHTDTSFLVRLTDDPAGAMAGNIIQLSVPYAVFTEGSVDVGGGNSEVTLPLRWAAFDGGLGYMVQIDMLPIT